ncbi:RIP metalloprotease RseP [Candidatus Uhrbacteria bacterium CG_4_9_14_3_um_filter_50_9]|uniref:Zinc metalloprotease n=1 Tax=Candidatus Uhrbacteria bacterium CG_4_9_14_3_um_filter_50_9 TaxID=1975035 RepID=A0A2M7XBA8_9BACT|nr:MAG: RIP metalloprotease RseP [Candidatus Uhrbacteria bacterium CG_4_9_14_3_um_filter_50_9]
MGTILLFIIVLSLLVFVHELGHFLMAKKMGMRVDEFGFGFPPRLFAIRRGGTDYSINWIPLGGFVKIKGESGAHKFETDSFSSKKAWQRFLVLIAGVAMNIFLAAILFSIGFMVGLPSQIDDTLPAGARVVDQEVLIMQVLESSPASGAGILPGDVLVSVDGRFFETDAEARAYIQERGEEPLSVIVEGEDGTDRTYVLSATYLEEVDATALGIGFITTGTVSYPFFTALVQGVGTTFSLTWEVLKAFVDLIRNLVSGQGVGVELSGPVGIAVMTGEVAALGLIYLLQFTAILSINLAIINVLPFPALDGGRILFLIIEKLRSKPVDERVEAVVHNLGFLFLMVLVVLVTYRDVVTFGDEIIGAIKGMVGV